MQRLSRNGAATTPHPRRRLAVVYRIDHHGIRRIEAAPGARILTRNGSVWITEGDARDIVLAPGESTIVRGPGPVLLTALGGAAIVEVEAHSSGQNLMTAA